MVKSNLLLLKWDGSRQEIYFNAYQAFGKRCKLLYNLHLFVYIPLSSIFVQIPKLPAAFDLRCDSHASINFFFVFARIAGTNKLFIILLRLLLLLFAQRSSHSLKYYRQ